ncbi:MAG TPA: glycine dehydrogenase (aminomethyl-transferring) [Planctomycetes bacterium]|nr:glycine dehydrogenase (aminomethyl-transferring) [Planctomycetota bacterium]
MSDSFLERHLGPRKSEQEEMARFLGFSSLEDLIGAAVPSSIRLGRELNLPAPLSEADSIQRLAELAEKNRVHRSFIGMGYYGTITPPVIQRNILENPGWYTQYTPYQPEISQGRLEALLIFQTMVMDLTGLEIANASLLDEATAAAEAMTLCRRVMSRSAGSRSRFFVAEDCHPQVLGVVRTRAEPLDIEVVTGSLDAFTLDESFFGALASYPATDGKIRDLRAFCDEVHRVGGLAVVDADLLALTLLETPAAMGADIAVGSSQRFGVPMGFGGPHAGYLATKDAYKRMVPGRIIGQTLDVDGKPALRMALQTREQHIRREKATSNICTAQVLLAIIAGMYAVWHGPEGLVAIAEELRGKTEGLARALAQLGHEVQDGPLFDTIRVRPSKGNPYQAAQALGINLRDFGDGSLGISLDETVQGADLSKILEAFGGAGKKVDRNSAPELPAPLKRTSPFLRHPTFHRYRSETEMMRFLHRLESRDLSLTSAMIPLGSCTMKLNAASEMLPISFPGFAHLHPFAPADQTQGYKELLDELASWLCEITGFAACSFQPNAGSQGEYTGLLVIRARHRSLGQEQRKVCLIPSSAHGTNPASSILAGMQVVVVRCDEQGNIDVDDLRSKAEEHREELAALMVTYPSTHGVFEESIREICEIVHQNGGLVYVDGANMNAMVGLSRPADLGGDVCHLNLHKTFAIPHGGGGPGMGPICVTEELAPFLPSHPVVKTGGEQGIGPVAAAPFGSPSILPISWAYIAMLGPEGLRRATEVAILNANYVARRLEAAYPVLYKGAKGLVAHECILDTRSFKAAGVEVKDLAKRLMDYSFHAPTMSWPVVGTLMVEPTESESKQELDRFCEALLQIREEIREIEMGEADPENNLLKGAPHPNHRLCSDTWEAPYSRERAAYPAKILRTYKQWPSSGRVDEVYGDRHLVCGLQDAE